MLEINCYLGAVLAEAKIALQKAVANFFSFFKFAFLAFCFSNLSGFTCHGR
jgi:hypothetical protein